MSIHTLQDRTAQDERVNTAAIEGRAPTVAHLFRDRVAASPQGEAFRFVADGSGELWESVTWTQVSERAHRLAAGLVALGIGPEDRVAIASSTRYEWALTDLAVMCAGGATTTIYPTTIAPDVSYILSNSGSTVVFAEDDDQIAKLRDRRVDLPRVARVVTFTGTPDGDWVIGLDELEQMGVELLATNPSVVDDRIDALRPDQLATIIYTSGTTGRPKGVRLTHDSWTYVAAAVDATGLLHEDDLQYLWLPLAHVFGKMLLTLPLQIGFPTAVDGRVDKIVDNLAVVQPTFMGAAPRIFEKAYARITMMMAAEGGLKEKLFRWSVSVGREVAQMRARGEEPTGMTAKKLALADKLVLHKVRARFGGRIRFFISGSAALNTDVATWFSSIGLTILEGYGLTESSAASFVNRPATNEIGTVGWALPGTEARIAEDGEVLLRGPGVMQGYHDKPEDTAETKDADGWLHTGDIGRLDDRGYLWVTDRKKDFFKTSSGKYVAPSMIEASFKGICPYVSQFMVYGADHNFVTALVTLDPDAITDWAANHGVSGSYRDIVTSKEAHDMVQVYVDTLNVNLNRWEQVKKFTILDHDLSIDEGDLTPSLKLRRKAVSAKYQEVLDSHYTA
ncbi:long-chain fatty acid--CoA ligase [Phycicoccus sp. Soil748]|uniref:AMP-dependent synthetase/ligase n=1 Tax=Phycicoccus sp. Soil748 TaxID=1736397 RepID=UPI000702C7EB|nr:AMP-dependent synthetase/ligase [Phycicoccus sp. Soil748]KRE55280.1 AMP-dependent synthetase [Phycicoccus sp. Soil748]